MATQRTLLLVRHAEAGDPPPGGGDIDRRLTTRGAEAARAVGAAIRAADLTVDRVLCSAAARTRETFELLDVGIDPERVEVSRDYYNAGADTLIAALRALDPADRTALMVGHAPGLPSVAYELADPDASDPAALAAIDGRFPAATLARLEFTGDWPELQTADLVDVRLP